MKKKTVLLHHAKSESFGILPEILISRHHSYTTMYAGAINCSLVENADLLIVLGGPISANDEDTYPFLSLEQLLLSKRVEKKMPTLGICLGAQLLAKSLGSSVYKSKTEEYGWSYLEISDTGKLSCINYLKKTPVFQWHSETFDLPSYAKQLASTKTCTNQAFAIGSEILGVQFHIEANEKKIQLLSDTNFNLPDQFNKIINQSKLCLHQWLDSVAL